MNKRIALLAPALLFASSFALADDPAKVKTIIVEVPVQVRTDIYLTRSKRVTAAKADRLLGTDAYGKRLAQRESMKPKHYIPRTVTLLVKTKESKDDE